MERFYPGGMILSWSRSLMPRLYPCESIAGNRVRRLRWTLLSGTRKLESLSIRAITEPNFSG